MSISDDEVEAMVTAVLNGFRGTPYWLQMTKYEVRAAILSLTHRLAEVRKQNPISDEGLRVIASKQIGIDDPNLCAELAGELLSLRAAAKVRAIREGDGEVALIDRAMDCDAWPAWLSDIVELTNQASDAADMSTEQAVAYGILQALAASPAATGGEGEC